MKGGRKLKRVFIVLISLVLAAGLAGVSFAGIDGSAHDFGGFGFSGGQICVPCHAPHNADTTVTEAPLWNHEVTTATYNLYSSATLTATLRQPDGSSKLCLSCHDGTVAVDSFGGNTGNIFISAFGAELDLTTDLSDDHPISFDYNQALSQSDVGLFDPTTKQVTIGSGQFSRTGSITEVMLENEVLQCSACHSVHNDFVVQDAATDALLKVSLADSELCLACHNK